MFITCHSVRWIPNLYELQQKEVGTVSGRVVTIVYLLWQTMQEDLSWPPWIQHTTHLSNLLLVVSTATSFYIYLLKHHARTETELPRPQHLYLAGHHQHSYRVAAVYLAELQTKFREGSPLQGPSPGSKHQIEHSMIHI